MRKRALIDDARVWDLSVVDFSFQMKRRVIWNADGNRPVRTVAAGLEWLLSSDDTCNTKVITADDLFDRADRVQMTARDYRDHFPVDLGEATKAQICGAGGIVAVNTGRRCRVDVR